MGLGKTKLSQTLIKKESAKIILFLILVKKQKFSFLYSNVKSLICKTINTRFNYIFYRYLLKKMLTSIAKSNKSHSNSSFDVGSHFLNARDIPKTEGKVAIRQKEQIESIRKMAKFIIQQDQSSKNKKHKLKTELSTQKNRVNNCKLSNIVNNNFPKNQHENINKHKSLISQQTIGQKKPSIHEQNRVIKLKNTTANSKLEITNLLKKTAEAVNQQPMRQQKLLGKINKQQKKLNYAKHSSKRDKQIVKKQAQKQKQEQKIHQKKVGSEKEISLIFEGVASRGYELKQRKQAKIKIAQQQKKKQQMNKVTFKPDIQLTKSLRNSCSKGFLQRLKDDEQRRQNKIAQILRKQLKKTTFKPKLNISHSQSKTESFRQQDLPYFNVKSKPQADFQQMLSGLSSSKCSVKSLTKSSVNHEFSLTNRVNLCSLLFQ